MEINVFIRTTIPGLQKSKKLLNNRKESQVVSDSLLPSSGHLDFDSPNTALLIFIQETQFR